MKVESSTSDQAKAIDGEIRTRTRSQTRSIRVREVRPKKDTLEMQAHVVTGRRRSISGTGEASSFWRTRFHSKPKGRRKKNVGEKMRSRYDLTRREKEEEKKNGLYSVGSPGPLRGCHRDHRKIGLY